MAGRLQDKHNERKELVKTRFKKGDIVKVIAGRDKGKSGRVLEIDRKEGRILVEGVMMMKKHVRPNPQRGIKGGIAEREASIHISNVMATTSDGKTTRIAVREEKTGTKTRRVRVSKKTGEPLDRK